MTERNAFAGLRWSILQTLQVGGRLGATESMIHTVLREQFPGQAHRQIILDQLAYLEQRGLLAIKRSTLHPWSATLTRRGMDVVAYAASCESGIARPKKYWHEKNGSAKQHPPTFTALHKALRYPPKMHVRQQQCASAD